LARSWAGHLGVPADGARTGASGPDAPEDPPDDPADLPDDLDDPDDPGITSDSPMRMRSGLERSLADTSADELTPNRAAMALTESPDRTTYEWRDDP